MVPGMLLQLSAACTVELFWIRTVELLPGLAGVAIFGRGWREVGSAAAQAPLAALPAAVQAL
jgi:hypothetical protein